MPERSESEASGADPAAQEAAFASSRADRDATLRALHRLEEAAGTAVPGRESDWLGQVLVDLRSLEQAVTTERDDSLRPDGLLSMIGRDYPRRFGARVRQLRDQLDDIGRQMASLREQLENLEGESADSADVRQRLGWLVRAIHHRREREADLVFEAIDLDLGRGSGE